MSYDTNIITKVATVYTFCFEFIHQTSIWFSIISSVFEFARLSCDEMSSSKNRFIIFGNMERFSMKIEFLDNLIFFISVLISTRCLMLDSKPHEDEFRKGISTFAQNFYQVTIIQMNYHFSNALNRKVKAI